MSIPEKSRGNSIRTIEKVLIRNIRKILLCWGQNNYFDFPWRSTDNHFHALVAEILLQRTRAEQVVPVFRKFASDYSTIDKASEEDPKKILELLRPLGLECRARRIVELITMLSQNKCKIPVSNKELLNLPGVGFYAASAYSTFHANIRALIVDSNSVRLWSRVFGFKADDETRRKKDFRQLVNSVTPKRNHKKFNYAVLDFTRCVCKPKPLCEICPLISLCSYYQKKSVSTNLSDRSFRRI